MGGSSGAPLNVSSHIGGLEFGWASPRDRVNTLSCDAAWREDVHKGDLGWIL